MDLLRELDLFTRPIYLRFQDDQIFRNQKGALLSIMVYGLIATLIYLYTQDVFQMSNPQISVVDQFLLGKEDFDFNPLTLPIAFSFLNRTTLKPFVNEKLIVPYIVYQTQDENNENTSISQQVVKAEICDRIYHFQNPQISSSWLNTLPFGKLYCLPQAIGQNLIGGNYGQGTSKILGIRIMKCLEQTGECQENSLMETELQTHYVNFYYNNLNIQPELNPPISVTGDSFYTTFNFRFPKEIHWIFQRIQIQSHSGYFINSNDIYQGVESNDGQLREMGLDDEDNILLDLYITIDAKKKVYKIYYKNLSAALGEVCGAISLLVSIIYLSLTPILKINYLEDFINNIFLIQYHDQYQPDFIEKYLGSNQITKELEISKRIAEMLTQTQIESKPKIRQEFNQNTTIDYKIPATPDSKLNKSLFPRDNFPDFNTGREVLQQINEKTHRSLSQQCSPNEFEFEKKVAQNRMQKHDNSGYSPKLMINTSNNLRYGEDQMFDKPQQLEDFKVMSPQYENDLRVITNSMKSNIKEKLQTNQKVIELSAKDNVSFLFNCCKDEQQSRIFQAGQSIINRDIDIVHIVSKLSEFEKLKKIILNDSQEVMFQFMTQPVMHFQLESKNIVVPNIDFNLNSLLIPDSLEKRTDDAFLAYCQLKNKINSGLDESQKELNQRLLDLIDPQIKQIFESTYSSLKYINYFNKFTPQ